MQTIRSIKQVVKDKYGSIARQNAGDSGCGCGCSPKNIDFGEDYRDLPGYLAAADLGLGCGLPTELARISPGDTVLDLGAGAGNDVFVARSMVGASGRVLGVDMTEEMVDQANKNLAQLGYDNVEFRLGEIENLPVGDNEVDVTISNCVLNLVPDKSQAFMEIYRTLKPGGHFCISDVVLSGELPQALQRSAEAYAGCVAGAMQEKDYLGVISTTGFQDIEVKKRRKITLSESLLDKFLDNKSRKLYHDQHIGIFSITVVASKASQPDPGAAS
jgi:ubiquinone/menaquinone biosynthesis C-methylase UbiE